MITPASWTQNATLVAWIEAALGTFAAAPVDVGVIVFEIRPPEGPDQAGALRTLASLMAIGTRAGRDSIHLVSRNAIVVLVPGEDLDGTRTVALRLAEAVRRDQEPRSVRAIGPVNAVIGRYRPGRGLVEMGQVTSVRRRSERSGTDTGERRAG